LAILAVFYEEKWMAELIDRSDFLPRGAASRLNILEEYQGKKI
jgi:hypothetical protein